MAYAPFAKDPTDLSSQLVLNLVQILIFDKPFSCQTFCPYRQQGLNKLV